MEFLDVSVTPDAAVNPTGRYNFLKILSNNDGNALGSGTPGETALTMYGNLDMNGNTIVNTTGAAVINSVIWKSGGEPSEGLVIGDSVALQVYIDENALTLNTIYCDATAGPLEINSVLNLNNTINLIGYSGNTSVYPTLIQVNTDGQIVNPNVLTNVSIQGISNAAPMLLYNNISGELFASINNCFIEFGNTAVPFVSCTGTGPIALICESLNVSSNSSPTNAWSVGNGCTLFIGIFGVSSLGSSSDVHFFGSSTSTGSLLLQTGPEAQVPLANQDLSDYNIAAAPAQNMSADDPNSYNPPQQFSKILSVQDFLNKLTSIPPVVPGGSNGQLQRNNSGVFGAAAIVNDGTGLLQATNWHINDDGSAGFNSNIDANAITVTQGVYSGGDLNLVPASTNVVIGDGSGSTETLSANAVGDFNISSVNGNINMNPASSFNVNAPSAVTMTAGTGSFNIESTAGNGEFLIPVGQTLTLDGGTIEIGQTNAGSMNIGNNTCGVEIQAQKYYENASVEITNTAPQINIGNSNVTTGMTISNPACTLTLDGSNLNIPNLPAVSTANGVLYSPTSGTVTYGQVTGTLPGPGIIVTNAIGAPSATSNIVDTSNTTGNLLLGATANTTATGNNLVGIGANALLTGTGSACVAIGQGALQVNQAGGVQNFALGQRALQSNQNGTNNVAIGTIALVFSQNDANNICIGNSAGENNNGGSGNCAIGSGSMQNWNSYTNGVFIGISADAGSSGLTGATAIGGGARAGGNNSTCIGANSSVSADNNISLGNGCSVVIGNTQANPAAILDCESSSQGFLPPQLSTVQKTSISSPPAGLMVYDNTLNQLSYYNGTIWVNV